VRSDAIVVVSTGFQNPAQMRLAQDNDVIVTALQVGSQLASERAFDRNVRRSRNSKKRLDDTYQYIYLPLRNKGKRSCTSEWPSFFRTLLNC
jgi:hypothetical protein